MNCPICHSGIPDDSVFCPVCGCNIEKEIQEERKRIEQAKDQSTVYCSQCETEGKENNSFSPECGCRIEDTSEIIQTSIENKKKLSTWKIATAAAVAICVALICVICVKEQKLTGLQKQNEEYAIKLEEQKQKIKKNEQTIQNDNKSINGLKEERNHLKKKAEQFEEVYNIATKKENIGFSTENFYAEKGIIVLKKDDKEAIVRIKMSYYCTIAYALSNNCIEASWDEFEGEYIDLHIYPISRGVCEIVISNNQYDNPFSIIAVVTD